MGKVKSFQSKTSKLSSILGEDTSGKVICPTCNTEVRKIKLVLAKDSKAGTWAPKYDIVDVCKCNESDVMNGNI
jgi:hypothetical protein